MLLPMLSLPIIYVDVDCISQKQNKTKNKQTLQKTEILNYHHQTDTHQTNRPKNHYILTYIHYTWKQTPGESVSFFVFNFSLESIIMMSK